MCISAQLATELIDFWTSEGRLTSQDNQNLVEEWLDAGCLKFIEDYTLECYKFIDVKEGFFYNQNFYQAYGDGINNDYDVIREALNIAQINQDTLTIIYFQPGDYLVHIPHGSQNVLSIPSNTILRGAGSSLTTFDFEMEYAKHYLGAYDFVHNFERCIEIHGNQNDYKSFVGIENIKFLREDIDSGVENPLGYYYRGQFINYIYAENCWIIGCEFFKSRYDHIRISNSQNIEIRECYIHSAYDFTGNHNDGYGITFGRFAFQCLIENNILRDLRHHITI